MNDAMNTWANLWRRTSLSAGRALMVCALLVACNRSGGRTAEEPSLEELRELAQENPRDAGAWRRLSIAELFREDGDPSRVQRTVAHALELAPEDATLHLVAGMEAYIHGRSTDALSAFTHSFERAAGRDPAVAEVAVGGIAELNGMAIGYDEAVDTRVRAALPRAGIAARAMAADLLIDLAYRKADAEGVKTAAQAAGCVEQWRVAGPFGPRDLLGFDVRHPASGPGAMADSYDLGVGRGVRPTRELWARGCDVHIGEGPLADGGTSYAEAFVDITEGGPQTIRLETPNAVKLFIDGEQVAAIDARSAPLQRVTFHSVDLAPGRHEIEVKVTTRHPNPIVSVSIVPGTSEVAVPQGRLLQCYLRASMRVARGFTIGARSALDSSECPDGVPTLALRSAVALLDPYVTADMRRDHARRLMAEVQRKDPEAWFPVLQLARLKAAEGRDQEAIADLRTALERWPELVSFRLVLTELLLNRGWDAEAEQHIEAALRAAPGVCAPIHAALAHAQRRDRVDRIDRYVDLLMECDARSSARFAQLVSARKWDLAAQELERLAELEPPQAKSRLLASKLQIVEGRAADADALLKQLIEDRPRSATYRMELADQQLARGEREAAIDGLNEAIAAEPTAMLELRRVRAMLGGEDVIEPFRIDGEAVVREYEQSDVTYTQPQVLVLDYTAVRVFEDGSALVLTHQIHKANSEEAVDELGQFEPPEDGYVLNLRTLKADGAKLEPDLIGNMSTINLPHVGIGDYVEQEYVRMLGPPAGIPGGILGERFYFQSFETPFYRTEEVVAVPQGMNLVVDPRGPAPEAKRETRVGLTWYRWRVDRSEPLVREPASVSPREYIPSVNWGAGAPWGLFLEGLRDVMADRSPADPAAVALARRIVRGARSDEAKAKRLYYWVLKNIENNNDVFGIAPTMISGRTGNRTRVLHYLLRLVGIQSELLLVRDFAADQTRSDLADDDTYSNLVLKLGNRFVVTSARGIPFGYVSPTMNGQDALVLVPYERSDEVRVVEVPEAPQGSEKRRIEVVIDVEEDGSAQMAVTEIFRGAQAIEWRNDLEGIPAAVLEERFEEGYAARVVPGARMQSLRISGQENPEEDFVLRYELEVPQLARRQGNRLVLPGLFPTQLTPRFAQMSARTTGQLVGPPLDIDVELRIRAESGTAQPLAPVELRTPSGGRFVMRTTLDGDTLVVERHVRLPLMRVEPGDYAEFAAFMRQADAAEAREIPIQ